MKQYGESSRSPATKRTPVKVSWSPTVSPSGASQNFRSLIKSRTPVKFRSPLGQHSRTPVKFIRSPATSSPSRTPVKLFRTPTKAGKASTPVKLTRTPTKVDRSPYKMPVKHTSPVLIGSSPVVFTRSPVRTPIRTPTKSGKKRLRSLMGVRKNVMPMVDPIPQDTPTGTKAMPTSQAAPDHSTVTPTKVLRSDVMLVTPPRHGGSWEQVEGHSDPDESSLDPAAIHESASMVAFSLCTPTKDDPRDFHMAFKHVSHDHDYM